MANFYTDNDDIRFLFHYYPLAKLAELTEGDFSAAKKYDWAPENTEEALDNYNRILNTIGQISAEYIQPRSEGIDLEGNTLQDDGTVRYAQGMRENLEKLAQAQVMGFTLPYQYGGLNCPSMVYNISNEIISRADAPLMNLYGLQGIAETINAFAGDEIKQQYLPGFAEGKSTGAMVLTEPDAGSDLQAVKLHAYQNEKGQWLLHGVKRFITNGCGEVLLVLARSETDRSGGLGLSLFVCDQGPTVKVRRLENKLGIHGSPTCELFFNHTPCQLIGERQRGLVTYVMSLMNGARIGISVQSIGIAEAAYRVARDYAASRKQFGRTIDQFPAVRDMLIEMKLDIQAARTLTYETCWHVDHENAVLRKQTEGENLDKEQKKELKNEEKKYKRLNAMLTPMSKYYASEMANRVTYNAIQVLGGSGYMKDYPVERHARDARITTIYEGTSQLQVLAAVRGVCGGAAEKFLLEQEAHPYPDSVHDLLQTLKQGREKLIEAIAFVKAQSGTDYMDLWGRALVDAAIDLIVGHLFLQQSLSQPAWKSEFCNAPKKNGSEKENTAKTTDNNPPAPSPYEQVRKQKEHLARRFITRRAGRVQALCLEISSGDASSLDLFDQLMGPLPTE